MNRRVLYGLLCSFIISLPVSSKTLSLEKIDYSLKARHAGVLTLQFNQVPDVRLNKTGQTLRLFMPDTDILNGIERKIDVSDFDTALESVEAVRQRSPSGLIILLTGNRDFEYVVRRKDNALKITITDLSYHNTKAVKSHELISVDLHNVPLKQALMTLADMAQLDVILDDTLTQTVTLKMTDIPWQAAWQSLIDMHALKAIFSRGVVRLIPSEQYSLDAAYAEDGLAAAPITQQIKVHYADATKIAAVIEKQLRSTDSQSTVSNKAKWQQYSLLSDNGRVSVDERTNSLIVKEHPALMPQVTSLVAKLDVPVPQVEIETRLVQVTEDAGKDIGVRLGFALSSVQNHRSNRPVYIGQAGTLSAGRQLRNGQLEGQFIPTNDDFLSINLPAAGISGNPPASYALSLYAPTMHWLRALDIELSAIEAQGRGRILASPKILTLNKQRATIEQGQERLAIVESQQSASTEIQKAVLKLSVLPQITPGNDIVLNVDISNDNFVDALAGLVSTSRINTHVRLNDGETMMIGGIYTEAEASNTAKVPLLGDLPFIGNVFKRRSSLSQRAELLVFLTPRIIQARD